jgi:hypothetical protein
VFVQEPGADLINLWHRARANSDDAKSPASSPLSSLGPSAFDSPLTPLSTGSRSDSDVSMAHEARTQHLLDAVTTRLQSAQSTDTLSSKARPLTAKDSKRLKDQKKGSKKRRQQKRELLGQKPGGKTLPSSLALKTALQTEVVRSLTTLKDIKTSHNGWMGSHSTKDVNDSRDFSLEDLVGKESEYKMKLVEYTGP